MPGLTESTLYENQDHTVSLKITYTHLIYNITSTNNAPSPLTDESESMKDIYANEDYHL